MFLALPSSRRACAARSARRTAAARASRLTPAVCKPHSRSGSCSWLSPLPAARRGKSRRSSAEPPACCSRLASAFNRISFTASGSAPGVRSARRGETTSISLHGLDSTSPLCRRRSAMCTAWASSSSVGFTTFYLPLEDLSHMDEDQYTTTRAGQKHQATGCVRPGRGGFWLRMVGVRARRSRCTRFLNLDRYQLRTPG